MKRTYTNIIISDIENKINNLEFNADNISDLMDNYNELFSEIDLVMNNYTYNKFKLKFYDNSETIFTNWDEFIYICKYCL